MRLYILILLQLLLTPYSSRVQSVPSIVQSILELASRRGEESSCTSCPCTTHYDPICGTDFNTYTNKCFMDCARMRCPTMMKGISVLHKGKCEDKKSVKNEDKDCGGDCNCGSSYEPVCGSDGVKYDSKCSFYCSKANCPDSMKEVVIAGSCEERKVPNVDCFGCTCVRRFAPICGTNNRTFDNQCIFDCAKNRCPEMMRGVEIRNFGTCGSISDTRRDPQNCFDGCFCTKVMAPICGSNGETYNNQCMFDCKKRNCPTAMQSVEIEYFGNCGGRSGGRGDQENCYQSCHCTRIMAPLCGSNGETFNNKCMFNCKKRNCPSTMRGVDIVYSGKCGGTLGGGRDQENCFQSCHCTRIMAPICGSNGETFNNDCMFNCKKRNCPNTMRGVEIEHLGNCRGRSDGRADQGDCFQSCHCTRIMAPLCGSNGETFNNNCMFNCKKRNCPRTMRGVTLRSEGTCGHPPPNESCFACICPRGGTPVCGTDGHEYDNDCMFQCAKRRCRVAMMGVSIRYRGRCVLPK